MPKELIQLLTSNRVNNVVTNFATDRRVKTLLEDPTACQYVSKEIGWKILLLLLKVLLAGHIHTDANVRAFYAIGDKQEFEPIFTPFPGFNNLNNRGEVINAQDSDGQSDKFVPKNNLLISETQHNLVIIPLLQIVYLHLDIIELNFINWYKSVLCS